jgi:hypothetical protein
VRWKKRERHEFPLPWKRLRMLRYEPRYQYCVKCGEKRWKLWNSTKCKGKPDDRATR